MKNWRLFIKVYFLVICWSLFLGSCKKAIKNNIKVDASLGDSMLNITVSNPTTFRKDSDTVTIKQKKRNVNYQPKPLQEQLSTQPTVIKDSNKPKLVKNISINIPPSVLDEEPSFDSYDTAKYVYVKRRADGKWWRRSKHPNYVPHIQGEGK